MLSNYLRFLSRAAIAGAVLLPQATSAHDVWVTIAGDARERIAIVHYGHPDDRPPALADKILDLDAISAGDRRSLLKGLGYTSEGGAVVVRSKPFTDDGRLLIAVRYDNGFWTATADGAMRNVTRRLVPSATEGLWSVKFGKAITGRGAPFQNVLGHDLEIVPLADPAAVKVGDSLRLRVLFRGKPLAGAQVERGDSKTAMPENEIPRFKTNADGVVAVPIVKAGPHLLVIDHRVTPSLTPDQASSDFYNATLWFVVGDS